MNALDVWMGGMRVGVLTRRARTVEFTFDKEVVQSYPASPMLSVAMLVRTPTWRGDVPEAFFGGLLPEGEIRKMLAYDFDVDDVDDDVAMLEQLGRDCAGALQVLSAGRAPDLDGGAFDAMSDAEVAERLRKLRFNPLGVDERVRVSLAGMQEKMVLAARDGGWSLPVDGAPSTHIFKPPHAFLQESVANEALSMRIAHHAGVHVAPVCRARFEERETLIVERYDRELSEGRVHRIHQEDLCQAHARPARFKYEQHGGPTFVSCAQVIRDWTSSDESLLRLLDIATVNIAIGNADAHAKNYSLLHFSSGRMELAPAYDLMATLYYPQVERTMGMYINDVRDIAAVSFDDLRLEAARWGLPGHAVHERMGRLLAALPSALSDAVDEVEPPEELAAWMEQRFRGLGVR